MNDELRHANYKYIKREWKNGRWQYTYADDKNNTGTLYNDPRGNRPSPKAMDAKALARAKFNAVAANAYRRAKTLVKKPAAAQPTITDDQNAARKYESANKDKKTSKSAMQVSKNDLAKGQKPVTKTPAAPAPTLKDKVKDAAGYDEKSNYEQKKAALDSKNKELEKVTQELNSLSRMGSKAKSSIEYKRVTASLRTKQNMLAQEKARLESETSKAKSAYSKTAVGAKNNAEEWLKKRFGRK